MQPTTPDDPTFDDIPTAVGEVLSIELADRRAAVVAVDERLASAADELVRFTLGGGKRLRPQFLWCGWLAGGGRPDGPQAAQVIRIGAALELIQACALVHDDIIDRSDTRRGEPSVHREMGRQHREAGLQGDADQYGTGIALILGDLALAWADDLFFTALTALGAPAGAAGAWRDMRTEVLAGQLLDLRTAAQDVDPEQQAVDALRVNRFKTAAYTVERPLHLGAALAGAESQTIGHLRDFGRDVGIAFQLRDDVLGVFGDPVVTGKPAGDDLAEGKKTLLLALARGELAGTSALSELDAGVGSVTDPGHVGRLTAIIAGTGALDRLEKDIDALMASGSSSLDRAGVPAAADQRIRALAVAATRRVS